MLEEATTAGVVAVVAVVAVAAVVQDQLHRVFIEGESSANKFYNPLEEEQLKHWKQWEQPMGLSLERCSRLRRWRRHRNVPRPRPLGDKTVGRIVLPIRTEQHYLLHETMGTTRRRVHERLLAEG